MESVSGCASEFGDSLRLSLRRCGMPGGDAARPDEGRPMRADAKRNYERIVATAKELFAADGASVLHDELPPWAALEAWLGEHVTWIVERHKLAGILKESIDAGSETFQ